MDKILDKAIIAGYLNKISELIFYLLLIFTPFAYGSVEIWSQMLAHFLVYGLIIFYLLGKFLSGDKSLNLPVSWLLVSLFLFWSVISTIWITVYRYNSILYVLRLIDYSLIIIYAANQFASLEKRKRLLIFLSCLGAVISLYGLLNYFARPEVFRTLVAIGSFGAAAPYVNHNHFAGYLEMALCCAVGLFFYSFKKLRAEVSLFLLILVLVMFVGLLFSLSRAGIISFLLVLTFFSLVMLFRRRSGFVITPAILLACLAIGYLSILETDKVEKRLKTLGDSATILTLNSRTLAWKAAYQGIKDNPIKGYGPGNFATAVPPYREPGIRPRFYYAHNDYLQLWFEYGLPGILLATVGIILFWRKLWRYLWKTREQADYLLLGPAAGILALLLHSFIDFNLNLHANTLLFFLLVALVGNRGYALKNNPGRVTGVLVISILFLLHIGVGASYAVQSFRTALVEHKAKDLTPESSPFEFIELYQLSSEMVPENADYPFKVGYQYVLAARQFETPYFYTKAKEYFDNSLILNPAASEVWLAKAFLAVETNAGDAEIYFRRALERDLRNPACYFYISDYLLTAGRLGEAIEFSRRGLELDTGFFRHRLERIWQYTQDIDSLVELIPDSLSAGHFRLADHLFRNGRYEDALKQLTLCAEPVRNGLPYYNLAGRVYQALELPDSAEACYRFGIRNLPGDMANYRSLTQLFFRQQRFQEAEAVFIQALTIPEVKDKAELHYQYALYFGRKKDYNAQRTQIIQALSTDLNNPVYLEVLADSYIGEERYYEALRELRRAEALDPKRISTFRRIAAIYEKLEQADRAAAYCGKILALRPGDQFALEMTSRLAKNNGGT